jgi:hypothetical protein
MGGRFLRFRGPRKSFRGQLGSVLVHSWDKQRKEYQAKKQNEKTKTK